jgi:hypothetical protein
MMWFKRLNYVAGVIALSLSAVINQAQAQSETPKFEIGAQFSQLRIGNIIGELDISDPGVGGRATWNINDYLGIEGEFNLFPERNENISGGGGRKVQGLFGGKIGKRSEHFGVFAKVRPGFVNFDKRIVRCPPGQLCPAVIQFYNKTEFALDAGGVVEFYPSRSTVARFDVGDTIIRFTDRGYPNRMTNNLQFSVGFGFRF